MYGSSLMLVTRMLRDSRIAAREAAAMPFPNEETTPPVTKTYFAIYLRRVGMGQFTRFPQSLQNRSTFLPSLSVRGGTGHESKPGGRSLRSNRSARNRARRCRVCRRPHLRLSRRAADARSLD